MDALKQTIKDALSEWFVSSAKTVGQFIMDESFSIAVCCGLTCVVFIMGGSKKAKVWLYWTIFGYVVVQIGGAALALTE